MLEDMTKNLTDPKRLEVKEYLSKTFIDRLTWISERLPKELRGTYLANPKPKASKPS